MKQPDILIFMSDQHAAYYTGYESGLVDTPVLDSIARNGTTFTNTYASCPLCVPSRMSFLSGKLPSTTGILTNNDTLPDLTPTFLHPLVAAGYETVLIGRMHFLGQDKRHGFLRREAGDITPVTWTRPHEKLAKAHGAFAPTFLWSGALETMGGGESPVTYYDRYVIDRALNYLSQEHDKPQCIVVGTYGPHFPYAAPAILYQKYKERVKLPKTFGQTPEYMNFFLRERQLQASEEQCRQAMAAYLALIELADSQIGQVRRAFADYTAHAGHDAVFCYLSDHGDTVGERNIFGKNTFFENSVRVPFLMEGTNLPKNRQVNENVSLMDIGPTLCELAGTTFQGGVDGISLMEHLQPEEKESGDRIIVSQLWESTLPWKKNKQTTCAIMLKKRNFKFISYYGYEEQDMLFDVINDPQETNNLLHSYPELVKEFRAYAAKVAVPEEIVEGQRLKVRNAKWFAAYEDAIGWDEREQWQDIPPEATLAPEIL